MNQESLESWQERTNQFNNSCQELVGIALYGDGLSPVDAARGFVDRLSEPQGRYEATFFSGRLLEMALRWGEVVHTRAHENTEDRCSFSVAKVTRRVWKNSDEVPNVQFVQWAEEFFSELERDHLPPAPVRAARRLATGFAAPLNVAELARQSGAQVAALRRAFKPYFGVTIRSYHIRVRVLEAVKLLPDPRFDGRSLACAVGYSSHKNFYRAVKSVTGLSLGELRSIPHAEALERAALPKPLTNQKR